MRQISKVMVRESMTAKTPICSPVGLDNYKDHGTCFSDDALAELAKSWNRKNSNKPPITSSDAKIIRTKLNEVMKGDCGNGKSAELCWVQTLGGASQNRKAASMLMPPKPKDWSKNPRKWLNNYDITHILTRFEGDKQYPYKLLGVYPIDFQAFYPEMRDFDLNQYIGNYRFLGLITNLDTHDGPGTHWTSSFICLDPSLPSFGAYYYDSTFNNNTDVHRVPKEIRKFFKLLKVQAESTTHRPFRNVFYRLNHQKGNTECGMFSIFYQVHWLRSIIKNRDTTHKDIVRLKITDDQVFKLRDFFFRSTT